METLRAADRSVSGFRPRTSRYGRRVARSQSPGRGCHVAGGGSLGLGPPAAAVYVAGGESLAADIDVAGSRALGLNLPAVDVYVADGGSHGRGSEKASMPKWIRLSPNGKK